MLSDRGRRALLDIVENAEAAREFIADLRFEEFAADRRNLYAVIRCLEIISEASRRIDDATRNRHPGIPWRQIASAGNIYRHDYDNISTAMIWHTVRDDLPDLLIACTAELLLPGDGS